MEPTDKSSLSRFLGKLLPGKRAKAQAEMRGKEPDLAAIAQEYGVPVDEFENIDLNCEEYACDWDSPVSIKPV